MILLLFFSSDSGYHPTMGKHIDRIMDIGGKLETGSLLLQGPKMAGKTSLVEKRLRQEALLYLSFRDVRTLDAFSSRPGYLEKRLWGKAEGLVIIDEVQLFPEVLAEVGHLMEETSLRFLLIASSVRDLRREGFDLPEATHLHPLVWPEIRNASPSLERIFTSGLLAKMFLSKSPEKLARNHILSYIKDEISPEIARRNREKFASFLELSAAKSTEIVNCSDIAREVGVSADTVKLWYRLLEDTFMGSYLEPYSKGSTQRAKFYFFDPAIARTAARMSVPTETMSEYGKLFENYIFGEIRAYLDYNALDDELNFWRTREGYEVDFVIPGKVAIETKTTKNVTKRDLRGLRAFKEEGAVKDYIVVSREPFERWEDDIRILPWKLFLEELWQGRIL